MAHPGGGGLKGSSHQVNTENIISRWLPAKPGKCNFRRSRRYFHQTNIGTLRANQVNTENIISRWLLAKPGKCHFRRSRRYFPKKILCSYAPTA